MAAKLKLGFLSNILTLFNNNLCDISNAVVKIAIKCNFTQFTKYSFISLPLNAVDVIFFEVK